MNEKDRGIIQLICGIPIIFANGIVLHILWKYINVSVPGNILMLNLSSADILVGIVLIWQSIFNLIDYLQALPDVCVFRFSSMVFVSFASLFAVLLTAVERLLCVCYHGKYTSVTRKKTVAVVFGTWIYCALLTIWPVVTEQFVAIRNSTGCIPPKEYIIFIPVQYFIILFSMCTMYVMMCRAAVTKRRQIVSVESNLVLNSRLMKFQHELRAAKFMAVILVIFMFCWTPFAISLVYQASTTKLNELLIHISEISAFFGVLNSFVNPIVYPLQNRRFRNATYQIFDRIKRRFAKPQQDTFSTVI
ncbi:ADRA1B [Mytilus coruscus]|uniref:ADRA1B n=1 Tax=Mytilus coruscus TaxID=42192 RepID=A0A6J8BKY2_MYTCO|nr:ADRA1B [Mytilus coruscus]